MYEGLSRAGPGDNASARRVLDVLGTEAKKQGVDDRIETKNVSMLDLEFENETVDIVWSEGTLSGNSRGVCGFAGSW